MPERRRHFATSTSMDAALSTYRKPSRRRRFRTPGACRRRPARIAVLTVMQRPDGTTTGLRDRSHPPHASLEFLRIVALALGAAILNGVLHDQVTARICVEYFTIGHPPLFP